MKKYNYLILLALFCFSCSQKFFVPGVYFSGFEKLQLHEDSTYTYEKRLEWMQSASHGKWDLMDDKVILNSFFVYEKLPIKVEKSNQERKHIRIHLEPELFMDSPHLGSLKFFLIINEKERIEFNDFKIDLPANKEISSLKVEIQIDPSGFINKTRKSLSTEVYFLNENQYSDYFISFPFNWKMLYSESIINDTLIFEGKKLFWPEKGKVSFKKSK